MGEFLMAGEKRSKAKRGSRTSPRKKQFTQKQLAQFRASMEKGITMPVAYDAQSGSGSDADE